MLKVFTVWECTISTPRWPEDPCHVQLHVFRYRALGYLKQVLTNKYFLKKILNASIDLLSILPVKGKNIKTFRWKY